MCFALASLTNPTSSESESEHYGSDYGHESACYKNWRPNHTHFHKCSYGWGKHNCMDADADADADTDGDGDVLELELELDSEALDTGRLLEVEVEVGEADGVEEQQRT